MRYRAWFVLLIGVMGVVVLMVALDVGEIFRQADTQPLPTSAKHWIIAGHK